MLIERMKTLPLAVLASMIVMLGFMMGVEAAGAWAAEAPIKEILSRSIGREVDKTTKGNVCTVASQHECGEGLPGSEPGEFEDPEGIAVQTDPANPNHGDVYVGDRGNSRVEEFTPAGEFVLMFGGEVDKTTKGNVCTKASNNVCGAGVQGVGAGQFEEVQSLTVDPATGDVYIQEGAVSNQRVEQYTPDGVFVWMSGREVDATKTAVVKALEAKGGKPTPTQVEEENLCTASSGDECQGGVSGSNGHGQFEFDGSGQNKIAVGGPEDRLYVGGNSRVQQFSATGEWKSETTVAGLVQALAVNKAGDMFVAYDQSSVIYELGPSGVQLNQFSIQPRTAHPLETELDTIALDSSGQLAVSEREKGSDNINHNINRFFGSLYDASTGRRITEFQTPTTYPTRGLAFDDENNLYGVVTSSHEAVFYTHRPVGELVATPVSCGPGGESETDVLLACVLNGEVDPWGVKETMVHFEWGLTAALGEVTSPVVSVPSTKAEGEEEPPVKVSAAIGTARPNEKVFDRLSGEDKNVKAPEVLTSNTASFSTASVPPRVVGEPSVEFVHSSSVVLVGELNPENMSTSYYFEYGPCPQLAGCAEVSRTGTLQSPEYGKVGVTLEASGLQPGTTYSYRLAAVNEAHETAMNEHGLPGLPEGSFTTLPAPAPSASTGPPSTVGVSSATITGTVDPDGQPATYAFELGIYAGSATRYGIVFSGPAGASGAVPETLALSGLQPGTTYAYRITIKSGYTPGGEPVTGGTVLFTTLGLPSVLVLPPVLAQLPVPNIMFPAAVTPVALTKAKALSSAQKLTKALQACTRAGGSSRQQRQKRRLACEKRARARYAKTKQANKKG